MFSLKSKKIFTLIGITLFLLQNLLHAQTLCQQLQATPVSSTVFNLSVNSNALPTNTVPPPVSATISNVQNAVIVITGTVTLSAKFTNLSNCDIRLRANATLVVPFNRSLNLNNCRIAAENCNSAWNAIRVTGNLTVINSTIEDAQSAVQVNGRGNIYCTGNIFNRNLIGIKIENGEGMYEISNNNFTKTSNLINEPTAKSGTSVSGIVVNNIPFISVSSNTFNSLNWGIRVNNSIMDVNRCSFVDMKTFSWYPPNFVGGEGTGILSSNSVVRVNGSGVGSTSPINFDNCIAYGIFATQSSITCNNTKSEKVGSRGFQIQQCDFGDVNVSSNTLSNIGSVVQDNTGMITVGREGQGQDQISKNDIKIDRNSQSINGGNRGIVEVMSPPSMSIIADNTISSSYTTPATATLQTFGIRAFNVSGGDIGIARNKINMGSLLNNQTHGILISGNSTGTIEVVSNSVIGTISKGIAATNSMNTIYCQNRVNGPELGMFIEQPSSGSLVSGNQLSGNKLDALRLNGNGISLGDQQDFGNRFLGTNATHTGGDFQFSRFIVNNDVNKCGEVDYLPITVTPQPWFQEEQNCVNACAIQMKTACRGRENFEDALLDGSIEEYSYSHAELWEAERNFYIRIQNCKNLLEDPKSHEFFDSRTETTIGRFVEIEQLISEALSPNGELLADKLKEAFTLRDKMMTNATEMHNIWTEDTENEELSAKYQEVLDQLTEAKQAADELYREYRTYKQQWLSVALKENQNINTNTSNEQYKKTINNYYIRLLLEEGLNEKEWSAIRTIANVCYKNGGSATNMARNLLTQHKNEDISEPECSATGTKVQSIVHTTYVFPNPVKDDLKIGFSDNTLDKNSTFKAVVTNIYGQTVFTANRMYKNDAIDTRSFGNGVYMLTLYDENNQIIDTQRFVKQ